MIVPLELCGQGPGIDGLFASPQSTYEAYAAGKVIGCAVDAEGLPADVRKYARYEEDRFRDELGKDSYTFEQVAPGDLYADWDGKLCVPYVHYLKLDAAKGMQGRQLTGDCVSWSKRTMIDVARCFEIGALGEMEEYVLRGATALLYSMRGHTGAGASPARLANAATKVGLLLEQVYTAPDGKKWDFTNYDSYYRIGMSYGRTGLPDWIIQITSQNRPQQVAQITSDTGLLTALWNGNGVGCGSNIGVSSRGGKDGVPFLSALQGRWPHDMAIVGFDARRKYHKDVLVIWDNSWGNWNSISGWPVEYGPKPEGAFVLTLADTMRAVRDRGCHALSDHLGFRPRRQKTLGAEGVI